MIFKTRPPSTRHFFLKKTKKSLNKNANQTYYYMYELAHKRTSCAGFKHIIIINEKSFKFMAKYICKICGYVYDPEIGDADGGVAPGTPFEEIPDDWSCPLCGVGKEDFELEE